MHPRAKLATAAVLLALFAPGPGHAEMWSRTRPDGTMEFTNRRPSGAGWSYQRDHGAPPAEKRPAEPAAAPESDTRPEVPMAAPTPRSTSSSGGTFWAREREDGVVEFTNIRPIGGRWKVWLRTGPGKAAAVRGTTDLVPAHDFSPERFSRYDRHIQDQQAYYGIPEALVRAVIKTESDYNPDVVSSAGARGLMQLMPETARLMGVTNVFDPRQNIMGGCRYLQTLVRRFCKTPQRDGAEVRLVCSPEEHVKVIAGYHAGPGAVERYGGLPPYETTRAYVTAVLRRY